MFCRVENLTMLQNGIFTNSAHPNGAPCSTKCPFKLLTLTVPTLMVPTLMEPTLTVPTLMEPTLTVHTLTVPTLMVHLVAPNVLLNKHLHAVMSEVPGKKKSKKSKKKKNVTKSLPRKFGFCVEVGS